MANSSTGSSRGDDPRTARRGPGSQEDAVAVKARRFAQLLLMGMSLYCLSTCPHSKVEESFNLQATHDLIYHGITPALLQSTSSIWYDPATAKSPLPTDLPYDHLSYPGVVPRTFLGPFLISCMIQILRVPMLWANIDILDHALFVQTVARGILMMATIISWYQLARAIDTKTTTSLSSSKPSQQQSITTPSYSATGTYFLLITACQFHMPFYSSRMLPNVFALVFVLQSIKFWLLGNATISAALLVFGTAVFRCDLLLLLFTVGLSFLVTKKLTILQAVQIGVATGVTSLILTVPLDSVLWQRWVWPEGEVLYYNTILGKSSNWGTSPWHWYVTRALPKMLLAGSVLLPCAFVSLPETIVAWWESSSTSSTASTASTASTSSRRQQQSSSSSSITTIIDTTWVEYQLPAVGYVGLYSCLGHKEVRFLFPVIPLFNLAIAIGMNRFHKLVFPPPNKGKEKRISKVAQLGWLVCIGLLVISFLASISFVAVSQKNYPGGDALLKLEQHLTDSLTKQGLVPNEPAEVRLYIDVAAAMSGISLFGQRHAAATTATSRDGSNSDNNNPLEWKITKAGYEDEHALKEDYFEYSASFTHMITEANPSSDEGNSKNKRLSTNAYTLIDVVPGKPRLDPKRGRIATEDYLYIWERIGYWQGIRGGGGGGSRSRGF